MSKTLAIGKEIKPQALQQNGNNSNDLRKWVAVEYQAIRELIPGTAMSDEATTLFLERLVGIAEQIGVSAFHGVIIKAIDSCERRPTIATVRRLAGLRVDYPSPAVLAWELVTRVVCRHLGRDGNGMAVLEPKTRIVDGVAIEEPVPEIPEAVKRAVGAMGGWTNLADSYPPYWGMRFKDFRELFHQDDSSLSGSSAMQIPRESQ